MCPSPTSSDATSTPSIFPSSTPVLPDVIPHLPEYRKKSRLRKLETQLADLKGEIDSITVEIRVKEAKRESTPDVAEF